MIFLLTSCVVTRMCSSQVGTIEQSMFMGYTGYHWADISSAGSYEAVLKARLSRYYDFCEVIKHILELPYAFTFCTSKELGFALIGLGVR